MEDPDKNESNCTSFFVWDAVACFDEEDRRITLELRVTESSLVFFTSIDNQFIHAGSLKDLFDQCSRCRSISIRHSIELLWQGQPTGCQLTEVFEPNEALHAGVTTRLKLQFGEQTFETNGRSCLTEAMFELGDMIGTTTDWWLKICFDCRYSFDVLSGTLNDRDKLVCCRDSPAQHEEIVKQRKSSADRRRLNNGHHFINAFHKCAAWEPRVVESASLPLVRVSVL